MARPPIRRNVRFFPKHRRFVPEALRRIQSHYQLYFDELEAMRFADIEQLSQEEIAELLGVSRQTVQLILKRGREKIARALCEGVALEIGGGTYKVHHCPFVCQDCNHYFSLNSQEPATTCPNCGSQNIYCSSKSLCQNYCRRKKIR